MGVKQYSLNPLNVNLLRPCNPRKKAVSLMSSWMGAVTYAIMMRLRHLGREECHVIPCGRRIPESEHAVSMSLPTLQDVIGYEEKSAQVIASICSGYPRFVRHWTVERVQQFLKEQYSGDFRGSVIALHDAAACERLAKFLSMDLECLEGLPFGAVVIPQDGIEHRVTETLRFIQHTGLMLSSRQAEDYLIANGLKAQAQDEAVYAGDAPQGTVREALSGLYEVTAGDVALFPSGMNAFFSVFEALDRAQRKSGKDLWVQVGWLYLDTTEILKRFAAGHVSFAASEIDQIEAFIAENHQRIAGITTEILTNPLLKTPDIPRLSALARRYGLPLIVDVSMPTPVNVRIFPHADIAIESLTKFAGGYGDVMSGAAVFNARSEWGARAAAETKWGCPYERDIRRLAHRIRDYAVRMKRINANASALTEYFSQSRGVRELYWAEQPDSAAAYQSVRHENGGNGGVVSVVFEKPLAEVYDRLNLRKGPSFGAEFTLCMAYVYMAHYDLVSSESGRDCLRSEGLHPELLRISVGVEPVDELIRAFEVVV